MTSFCAQSSVSQSSRSLQPGSRSSQSKRAAEAAEAANGDSDLERLRKQKQPSMALLEGFDLPEDPLP